jgi:hypothetical protein
MKVHLKILTALLFIGCFMPMACKKDNTQTKKITEVNPPVPNQPANKLIPVQMGTGKSKMTFSYTADYSLSKVVYGDGTSAVMEFTTGGVPSYIAHYDGTEASSLTQYKLDNENRIISGKTFNIVDDQYTMTGMFRISYQSNSQISMISYYSSEEKLLVTENRVYAGNGNLIREQNNTGTVMANYAYDDKNGLFKNVQYGWLFAIEEQNKLFQSGPNNISSCSYPLAAANNLMISYTYNQDNYPETINTQVGGTKLNYKVTYKAIK